MTGTTTEPPRTAAPPAPAPPPRRRHRRITAVLEAIGKALLLAGVVLLLFTAYQIWGTAWQEAHTQAALRTTIGHEISTSLRHEPPPAPAPRPGQPPAVAAPATPPANGQPVGILRIPSIGLDQVVVEGIDETDLSKGPGLYPGSPLPGEAGNSSIAGHRTTWGHPFYDLDAVPVGAHVYVTTPQGSFTYTTQRVFVVDPSDSSVLAATTTPSLTLTTCNPRYSAAQRLVLRATLTASRLTGQAGSATYGHHRAPAHSAQLAGDTTGSWWDVVGWGAALLAAGTLLWLIARRLGRRWLVYLVGTPALLVLLYLLFVSVTPLLPASF